MDKGKKETGDVTVVLDNERRLLKDQAGRRVKDTRPVMKGLAKVSS